MASPTPFKPKFNSKTSYFKPETENRIHMYSTKRPFGPTAGSWLGRAIGALKTSPGDFVKLGATSGPPLWHLPSPRGRDLNTRKPSAITRN